MQLEGATELEVRLYETCRDADAQLPASELATRIVSAMSDAGNELQRLRSVAWTQQPPTEQGWYWNWNGDADCAPLPHSVMWGGLSGKCFVSRGQLGLTVAVDCDKYGGWWAPCEAPPIPAR